MTFPSLIFGFLISTFLGAAFHLIKGGSLFRLTLYIIFAWVGFWLGNALANHLGWTFLSVGPLHLGLAVPLCAASIALGYWLSLVNVNQQPKKQERR
jgi:hypothetical protein